MARGGGPALAGRVALVTGGAQGIGRETAAALAAAGVRVAIGDLDGERARRTARELGHGVVAFDLDVTDRESFALFASCAQDELGPPDILVNNAGIMLIGSFLEEDDAATRRLIDVNVHGVLNGMKLILPGMVERGRGHLVNVSSSLGRTGLSHAATYCGSKFFVYGVSEAIRAELRDTGVEVSCVMPGQVRTDLSAGLADSRAARDVGPEEVAAEIVSALRRPRFDVYVPRSIGPLTTFNGVLPRSARDALRRTLKVDSALEHADPAARRGYELRAGLEVAGALAGDTPPELPPGPES
jgi:NADP-dependent 3-hydroxy acid dehydrogenase YdfG